MNILKIAIITASIIGIVSTLVDFAAPQSSLKQQLKTIMTLVMITSIFMPFLGSGFKISQLSDYDLTSDSEYKNYSKEFGNMYILRTEDNIEAEISYQLSAADIDFSKVRIYCGLNEYNSIEVTKAEIYLPQGSSQRSKAQELINKLLPDTKAEFITEEEVEYH